MGSDVRHFNNHLWFFLTLQQRHNVFKKGTSTRPSRTPIVKWKKEAGKLSCCCQIFQPRLLILEGLFFPYSFFFFTFRSTNSPVRIEGQKWPALSVSALFYGMSSATNFLPRLVTFLASSLFKPSAFHYQLYTVLPWSISLQMSESCSILICRVICVKSALSQSATRVFTRVTFIMVDKSDTCKSTT